MKGSAFAIGRYFQNPRTPALLGMVLVIVSVAWQFYQDRQLIHSFPSDALVPQQLATKEVRHPPTISMSIASALNLMGEKPTEPEAVAAPPVVIPQTTLQLRLAGSFASPNEALAAAFIDVDGRGSRYFRVGDTITGDVELYAVDADSVTLKRNNNYEKLYFAGAAPSEIAAAAAVMAPNPVPVAPSQAHRPVGPAAVTSAAVTVVTPLASTYFPQDLSLTERLNRLRAAQRGETQ